MSVFVCRQVMEDLFAVPIGKCHFLLMSHDVGNAINMQQTLHRVAAVSSVVNWS